MTTKNKIEEIKDLFSQYDDGKIPFCFTSEEFIKELTEILEE